MRRLIAVIGLLGLAGRAAAAINGNTVLTFSLLGYALNGATLWMNFTVPVTVTTNGGPITVTIRPRQEVTVDVDTNGLGAQGRMTGTTYTGARGRPMTPLDVYPVVKYPASVGATILTSAGGGTWRTWVSPMNIGQLFLSSGYTSASYVVVNINGPYTTAASLGGPAQQNTGGPGKVVSLYNSPAPVDVNNPGSVTVWWSSAVGAKTETQLSLYWTVLQ